VALWIPVNPHAFQARQKQFTQKIYAIYKYEYIYYSTDSLLTAKKMNDIIINKK